MPGELGRVALARKSDNAVHYLSVSLNWIGGAEGDRTPDLMTASHALSQLSYGPLGEGGVFPTA